MDRYNGFSLRVVPEAYILVYHELRSVAVSHASTTVVHLKQVKMPKRPGKKGMETVHVDPLWAVERQSEDVIEEEEVEEEEVVSPPQTVRTIS